MKPRIEKDHVFQRNFLASRVRKSLVEESVVILRWTMLRLASNILVYSSCALTLFCFHNDNDEAVPVRGLFLRRFGQATLRHVTSSPWLCLKVGV